MQAKGGPVREIRGGDVVWIPPGEWQDLWTGRDAERIAMENPEHDWRIVLNAPLWNRTYQRQAPGLWVLVEQGRGFA